MAGGGSSKEQKGQQRRVGPSVDADVARRASRVSGAAGSLSASGIRAGQGGQSSKVSGKKAGGSASAARSTSLPATKRGQSGQSRQGQNGKSTRGRKGKSSGPAASVSPASPPKTQDTRFIDWARSTWNSLEPHHQQRVFGFLLLVLSLLLFAALTVFHSVAVLRPIAGFFTTFFGWSSYVLALGLVAFSLAHLVEGILNRRFIRWSLVIGLVMLWLIVLAESNLILGGKTGGVIAQLLVKPLLGWPVGVEHVVLIGLFVLVSILAFRITFGHVLMVGRALARVITGGEKNAPAGNAARPSPYLGQRPQYSRYGSYGAGMAPRGASDAGKVRLPGQGQALANEDEDEDEDEDGDTLINFESDFGDEDDPDNDINLHRREIGLVSRGGRAVAPLNRDEHSAAVQGAQQPPLPFNAPIAGDRGTQQAGARSKPDSMEPLQPNPLLAKLRKGKSVVDSPWKVPDTSILNNPDEVKLQMFGDDTQALAKIIQDTLRSFRVEAEVRPEDISIGPTVIRFGIRPTGKPEMRLDAQGRSVPVRDASGNIVYETRTRVSRIMALQNDLALVLEAKSIRMEAPVPGRPYVGVEIPNKNSRLVTLREVLESKEYQAAKAKSKLAIALGKDVAGAVRVGDLARMPHLLIAGATGAGKSVCINTIIASILTQATPEDVRLLMVDPKMVELNVYNGIPHLNFPVVTEVEKVVPLLKNAITEMERRYRDFSHLGVRNLDGYRKLRAERAAKGDTALKNLPAIVIIIDELADLMMAAPEEVEGMICRLAQLARATGIHLVIATQRPSVDVITGLIKANIPTRISFMVSSAVDSRTIIDMGGAERLLGRGDMLYLPADAGRPERIQGAFLADDEVERLVAYWRQQVQEHTGTQNVAEPPPVEPGWEIQERISDDFELEDDLLEKAEEVVREYGRASISLLQRRLRVGYSRAARLIDMLEERGIIGSFEANGRAREILDNDNGNGNGRSNFGPGRTMADEVADIIAEEKAREDSLKKQGGAGPTRDDDER
ncbi:MAG TPA: DNA translocase FtsK [Ktedonobacteraceae bacterium]|nr:DNA translocase FtsK [Ktedonobacteraceae bacterium]